MNSVIRMHASPMRVRAVTPGSDRRGPTPAPTTRRTSLSIDGRRFLLALSFDTEELEKKLVEAVRERGGMVSFTVAGDREVCVLVSPGVAVILEHEDVPVDEFEPDDAVQYDDVEYLT
ncbi:MULTISPECIES: hypothetical protein [unclassified Rathayibacter]|uniref:hypothetical protein n=1 Tax=unclassified Rathayibacter TaxID=2609250 RepID=UPI000F4C589F|nr:MULTISPECIES: hypothetical protein [unclassified Rathayibacter]MCJ1683912.1 hypothetical protein [Rathayibacter sp. VKM Ac-2928]MCJ1686704.1 hypothetical protein [Rathayibacter sp. VKM Ac-2927]MCJ1702839.1 hypothetical protein [Rathayibacter sp. VKM Ac-2926]ROP48765.1 hypothetical protein EDF45_2883 [Rathayibacter sp. PhB186]ROS49914.1 hypothetical protein EDF44_2885 [Rathayibacter sp. PhB185]